MTHNTASDYDNNNPYAAPMSASPTADGVEHGDTVRYFPTGRTKLVVMSVLTANLYQIYWFYKNWRYIRDTTGKSIPWLYALLSQLSGFSLFKYVRDTAKSEDIPSPGIRTFLVWPISF